MWRCHEGSPAVISRALSRSLRLVLVLIALVPVARAQQQTGSLLFEVKAADASPVVGAKISIMSEKVPGQDRETDEFGKARFLLLPPGAFTAQISKDGFNAHEEKGISVGLGQRVDVKVTLQPIMEESMEVAAPTETTAADVDFSQTRTASVMTSEQLQKVQLGSGGRSYLDALARTPGVAGTGNASVHGATLGENRYTIDGVNTTDPVTGTWGLLTNFDIIEQLEVSTGGFQAEYGGATGGIINQITKSGTNKFEGSFDIRHYTEAYVENSPHFQDHLPSEYTNWSATLLGPVVKNKLWFALSYQDEKTDRTPSGTDVTRGFEGHANLAKLTWEPAAGHRVSFQYTEDPASIDNANAGAFVDRTATYHQDQGASFYKLNYNGQLTDHWALSFLAGWYKSELNAFPMVDSGLPAVTDTRSGYAFQNYGNAQFSERTNDQYALQLQRSWSGKSGDHDLKFGYGFEDTGLDYDSRTPAGETWTSIGCADDPDTPEREETCLDADLNGDDVPDNVYELIRWHDAGPTNNEGKNEYAYVQDSWSHGRWVLDYGLRWERARAKRDDKREVLNVDLFQPRLGMSFDVKNDGMHKLYWSLSRRMHPGILTVPNAVNTHGTSSDYFYNESLINFDLDGDGVIEDAFSYYTTFGGPSGSSIDKGLEATHVDEIIVGYEHKLRPNMRLASRLVLNETKDIIEDTYDDASGAYIIKNIPELKREYRGVEIEYGWTHKRGQLLANATISHTRGNIEYTQGLGTDWDILPIHALNRWGRLSTDALVRLQVFGWVDLPKKWTISYDLSCRTGLPYERLRDADPYGFEFLDPRGSHRLPSFYTLDSEIRKNFSWGKTDRWNVQLIGTLMNITNANAITDKQEMDPDVGSNWGEPTAWQAARTLELGFRFYF